MHFLFPTVVRMTNVENAPSLNAGLLGAVAELRKRVPGDVPESWNATLYTTFGTLKTVHLEPGFADISAIVEREGNAFAHQLGMELGDNPMKIYSSWLNIYGAGHNQEPHVHSNSLISAVYYVKAPAGVAGLKILSPYSNTMLLPPIVETSPANMMFDELPVEDGRLILFRSWTRHSVRPNPTAGERISIAFNLK